MSHSCPPSLAVRCAEGFTVAVVGGVVDLGRAEELVCEVRARLGCCPGVVLDLSAVSALDVAVVRVLLGLGHLAGAHGLGVVLVAPAPVVVGRLALTGAGDWFETFGSVDVATDALARRRPGPGPHMAGPGRVGRGVAATASASA